ncbi:MAG TPA: TPM domain-containing protein [Xanthobacteraceae bacterium]|jgi:uncharacterized protein|nr:TPM domain-containing protein [Xanthobacteraceae bacterium]
MRAALNARIWLFLLGAFLLLAPGGIALAQNYDFPQLTGRVVDEANILDAATKIDLDTKLEGLETKTTTQFVIVTLKSLRGRTIEEYGYQLGRHWGIGQKGSNNGVMLIVAPNERKVRIEVGYGLEGTLTDAITSVIVQSKILPRFRVNDYQGGIRAGADAIIDVASGAGDEFKKEAQAPAKQHDSLSAFLGFLMIFFFQWPGLLFLIIFLHFFVQFLRKLFEWLGLTKPMTPQERKRRARNDWGWVVPTGGSSWGGGSGSGWSSGGGGFSGGGGSFGGGGSSGSW